MFKRLLVGLAMVFSMISAHAGVVITTSDFFLDFAPGTPESGGIGLMHIRYNHEGVAFQVNIAPFADSLNNVNHGIDNWLTPVTGSGWDFDPIDLYSIWAEDVIFSTSIGLGIATWNDGNIRKINFPDGYASWNLMKLDPPPAVSNVPEPSSLALLSIGMIGAGAIRRKQKKSGITTRRMSQVGNHLDAMTKNKPSLKQRVYNFIFLLDTRIILFLLFLLVVVKYYSW